MKRTALLTAVVAAAGLTWSGVAWGAVAGTPHDITVSSPSYADFGVCSACHIPHKSAGKRLWPQDMSGSETGIGEVGALCSYCHAVTTGIVTDAWTAYPFYDATNNPDVHKMNKGSAPDGAALLDGTLPYMSATSTKPMQCTSCHNVHDNTAANAFLQDDIDVLCARCHPGRQFADGTATTAQSAWSTDGTHYGDGNPGSHPVGTDVFTDTSQHDVTGDGTADADSPIEQAVIGIVDYDSAGSGNYGNYQLGPKLINGGTAWADGNGVGCVTCHTVHGRDTDAGSYTAAVAFPDLLAVEQAENSGHANGGGAAPDEANFLCEACHRGIPSSGYASTYFPNPGRADRYTHPVDDYREAVDVGVTAFPAGWPVGNGGSPGLLCESCHMPHPGAAMGATNTQTDPYVATGTHILRDDEVTICERCHGTAGVPNHHPVGTGLMTARFDSTMSVTVEDGEIGDGNADLTCYDCHNGSGAHNWTAEGAVGLDPDWMPYDNGRAADTTAAGPNAIADTSKTCLECHTAVNGTAHFSPARAANDGYGANAEFQYRGDASHYLGAVDLSAWGQGPSAQSGSAWLFNANNWATGGWSRFDGTDTLGGAVFVCESCHDVEPDKNDGNNALLLMDYSENKVESRSLLCEACHSPMGTAIGSPHPMTGDAIGRAETARNLITTGTTFANAAGAPGGDTTYPAADEMNCDSCHQVHNAIDTSGTYILEATGAASEITGTPAGAISIYTHSFAAQEYDGTEAVGTKLEYQPFCNLCHASGQ